MILLVPTYVLLFGFFWVLGLRKTNQGASLDRHPWAVLIRWLDLVDEDMILQKVEDQEPNPNGQKSSTTRRRLLEHDLGNSALCPCSLSSCSGSLPSRSAWYTLSYTIFYSVTYLACFYGMIYTPLVSLGLRFWSTWYFGLAGSLIAVTFIRTLHYEMISIGSINSFLLALSLRVHRRAARVCLKTLIALSTLLFVESTRRWTLFLLSCIES